MTVLLFLVHYAITLRPRWERKGFRSDRTILV